MAVQDISLSAFLEDVKERHHDQPERPFCFVLGSGASLESGIPTGAELVDRWLAKLHGRNGDSKTRVEDWANADTLGIPKFAYAHRAEFYGDIYEKIFRGKWDAGFRELETTFEKKEPSFGYSVLAWILANTPHKVVITPNFDNLVADALFLYGGVPPILCVHESLAGYVTHKLHRPLVVKFHRDLLFDPKSRQSQISVLADELREPLTNLFRNFTPVFIGYGGNDRGFMDFLEKLPDGVPDRIYWCIRTGSPPNDRVRKFLDRRDAFLVSTLGFDRLMLRLRDPLAVPDMVDDVEKRHAGRMESYRANLAALLKESQERSAATDATPEEVATATAATAAARETKEEDTPQSYILRARAQRDISAAEAIYREGLAKHPGNGDLMSALGEFLADEKQAFDEAENLIRSAYEKDPENHVRLHDYGVFLWSSRGDGKRAEPLLRWAVEKRTELFGPEHPDSLLSRNNLANALRAQGQFAEAEQEHRAVLALRKRVLGQQHPDVLASRNNLAAALHAQGKYAEAEHEHRAVLAVRERVLGPEHPETLKSRNNLAAAQYAQGKYGEAEQEHRAVLAIRERMLGPGDPDILTSRHNLANALGAQGKSVEAEREHRTVLILRERVLGHEHPDTLRSRNNLAFALHTQGKSAEAESEHRAVLALRERILGLEHPNTLNSRNNLAEALLTQGKTAEAEHEHREVLLLRVRALGSQHPDVLESCFNLALALNAQEKWDEALSFARQAEEGRKKSLGGEHPDHLKAKGLREMVEAKLFTQ